MPLPEEEPPSPPPADAREVGKVAAAPLATETFAVRATPAKQAPASASVAIDNFNVPGQQPFNTAR
jgi:hypothetical protein